MELILIAAMDLNRAIGKDNKLLYHLPADMTHFKELTTGNTVVMGRKTFESLPHGALPNRRNIVITKNEDFKAENCEICHSIDEMLKLCKDDEKVYVIGGESLYRQTIDIADRLELTVIMVESNGADRFFPKEDCFEWRNVLYEEHQGDEKNEYNYRFMTFERKKSHQVEKNITKFAGNTFVQALVDNHNSEERIVVSVRNHIKAKIEEEKKRLGITTNVDKKLSGEEVCKLFGCRPLKGVLPMLAKTIEPFYFSMHQGDEICKCCLTVPNQFYATRVMYDAYDFKYIEDLETFLNLLDYKKDKEETK